MSRPGAVELDSGDLNYLTRPHSEGTWQVVLFSSPAGAISAKNREELGGTTAETWAMGLLRLLGRILMNEMHGGSSCMFSSSVALACSK